ncbi:MAG TPA: lanthionine synthetase LanC family protein [Candidatus Saccharimonadales bacterium]|nr:lanthionine synthetase LanC family protein [Candidatus Saccharimonadales bacterium]
MKNIYLEEAIRIGDQLLATAIPSKDGISWLTIGIINDMPSSRKKFIDIYNGVAGIALFFLELYSLTNKQEYLLTAEQAMSWVAWYEKKYPSNYYAFITGNLGVSFVYLRFYEVTKKSSYLTNALSLAKKSNISLQDPSVPNDFLNGLSGTLLGLVHLYARTQKKWLLEYIYRYTEVLVRNAKFAKVGLYWDRNSYQIRPLCGFSHGSSGIGFVFLELGHYFKNPSFYFIAKQAFAYEDYYFDKRIRNWPYFVLPFSPTNYKKSLRKEYKQGNYKIFNEKGDKNTWCHGASGIGLSRVRMYELTKMFEKDISNALKKTKDAHLESFSLCHGMGGNAELFLESYLVFGNKNYLKYAEDIARQALEQKKRKKKYLPGIKFIPAKALENPSLFLGIAGIGYYLLRLSFPDKIPSLLAPKLTFSVERTPKIMSSFTHARIRRDLIEKHFPRTMQLLTANASSQIIVYFNQKAGNASEVDTFVQFVKELLPTIEVSKRNEIKKMLAHELRKITLENKSNYALLFIKHDIRERDATKLLKFPDKQLLTTQLQLASEVTFFKSNKESIFLQTVFGVKEQEINKFCKMVFESFRGGKRVKRVVDEITVLYDAKGDMKKTIDKNVLEQIREGIKYGILVRN